MSSWLGGKASSKNAAYPPVGLIVLHHQGFGAVGVVVVVVETEHVEPEQGVAEDRGPEANAVTHVIRPARVGHL